MAFRIGSMDDTLVKRIMPVGDLVDRYLINQIKMEKFPADQAAQLKEDNRCICQAIDLLIAGIDLDAWHRLKDQLLQVLRKQWDILDEYYRKGLTDSERGKLALIAQDVNNERVAVKNKINELAGSSIEYKKYGV